MNMDWVQFYFSGKYHDLKLTHNIIVVQAGYHSAINLVSTGDTSFAPENLTLVATVDQNYVEQFMARIFHLTYKNKILRNQIKQLPKSNKTL